MLAVRRNKRARTEDQENNHNQPNIEITPEVARPVKRAKTTKISVTKVIKPLEPLLLTPSLQIPVIVTQKKASCKETTKSAVIKPLEAQIPVIVVPEKTVPLPLKDQAQLLLDLKAIFRRSTAPKELLGREEEKKSIKQFLTGRISAKKGGSLYISGCPGAGKTAVVDEILAEIMREKPVKISKINCASTNCKKELQSFHPTELTILLLDEIDQLEQSLLYKLFELALLPTSCLILLGIANSLDLVDRTLPRLRAKHLEPELLHFAPYGVEAIKTIIRERLAGIDLALYDLPAGSVLFESPALELCARKLASSGDVRRVLDTCRKALEQAGGIPVKLPHVMKAISSSTASSQQLRIQAAPLHGKAILCVAMIEKGGEVEKLHAAYLKACSKVITPVSRSEFMDLVNNLESTGLVSLKKLKGTQKKLELLVSSPEITEALQGVPIVSAMLPLVTSG